MKILIVEDETHLLKVMSDYLEKEHYLIETAEDYEQALDKIVSYDYDCILLDVMLPHGSGLDLLTELKRLGKEDSVIIISAKDSVEDKITGLELGADDYLAKPFHLAELNARIKSILRRKNQQGELTMEYKNIVIYPSDRRVTVSGEELALNRKEYDLLYFFMSRPQKLVQKTTIAEGVWGDYTDQSDNLDFIYSQIKNLRRKLKDKKAEIDLQAVYGIGYKLM